MNTAFPFLTLTIVAVGAVLALQAPVNAVLARGIGDPVWAAALSFGVGFVFLTAVAVTRGQGLDVAGLRSVPWWALTGGALGGIWVLAALWSVAKLGAVTMISAMILGQMLAALAIDPSGLLGVTAKDLSATRICAVACVAMGMFLSFR